MKHYDVQTLTPSSKTQAKTGMDFRMLVLMRFISRLKINLVPLWEVTPGSGDPIPRGRIVGLPDIEALVRFPRLPGLAGQAR